MSHSDLTVRRRLILSIFAQLVSSGSNFAFIALLARASPAVSMGRFSLVLAAPLAWILIQRASCGVLVLSNVAAETLPQTVRLATRVAATGGVVTMLLTGVAGYLVSTTTEELATTLLIAAATPLLALQDCGRYVGLAYVRHMRVLLSDTVWLAVLVVAAFVAQGPVALAAFWCAGAGLAALVLIRGLSWTGGSSPGGDHRLRPLLLDGCITAAVPVLVMSALGLAGLPLVAAALRASATLFGPVNVMLASLATAGLAEVARSDARTGRRILDVLTAVAVAGACLWGALIVSVPEGLGMQIMGETWEIAMQVVPMTTAEVILIGLCLRYVTRLRASGMARSLLASRVVYVATMAVVMTGLALTSTEARAFAWGLVAAGLVYLVTLRISLRLAFPSHSSDADGPGSARSREDGAPI